ncbi:MAG: hypothetical protein WBD34_06665 [Burkholderiaceae bacterium]
MTDKTRLITLSVIFALPFLIIYWLSAQAKPVPVTSVGSANVACLSYAPYRLPGESPFRNQGKVTPERIQTDLTLLREVTNCVRTYAVTEGLDAVPAIAKSLGMQVMLGIWISRNHQENLSKISAALEVVNQYPESVRALIVGNEVLLRREQTAARIAQYLQIAQQGTDVPVTYADVWEFWEMNSSLQDHVDFVTVHILPYWEDHPVAVGKSVAHIANTYQHVTTIFPEKRVFIGETGWPSVGRMRGPARPGQVEQARFVREFLAYAQRNEFSDYNLIEAFDQPWKRQLEGAMGGGWGLLSSNGVVKFPMSGPVAAYPDALGRGLVWGGIAALAIALTTVLFAGAAGANAHHLSRLLIGGAAGFIGGALLPAQITYMVQWNRNPSEWMAGSAIVVSGWLLIALLPRLSPGQPQPGIAHLRRQSDLLSTLWTAARLVILFGATFMMVMHAFDARYRGYPTMLYLPAAVALIAACLAGNGINRGAIEEKFLAGLSLLLVPIMLWPEVPANSQSVWFAVTVVSLALATLAPAALRNNTNRPNSRPIAPNSAV